MKESSVDRSRHGQLTELTAIRIVFLHLRALSSSLREFLAHVQQTCAQIIPLLTGWHNQFGGLPHTSLESRVSWLLDVQQFPAHRSHTGAPGPRHPKLTFVSGFTRGVRKVYAL